MSKPNVTAPGVRVAGDTERLTLDVDLRWDEEPDLHLLAAPGGVGVHRIPFDTALHLMQGLSAVIADLTPAYIASMPSKPNLKAVPSPRASAADDPAGDAA